MNKKSFLFNAKIINPGMTHSPHVGVFVFSTPEDIMANLQALQSQDAVKQWRQSIKQAFNFQCAYCGTKSFNLTLDHVRPKTKGGENLATNIVPACISCNQAKGSHNWKVWYRTHTRYCIEREQFINNWISA